MAGLTLGGGLGYLTRRFGWTVDNLLEVEVVTADGRVRRASRDQEPELFWGIRGAGANLDVVTRFTYRLHPVGPSVYGGLIAWPFERAEEVMAAYRTITSRAPRELTVFLVLLKAPPAPFVPPAWQGRRIVAMAVCYSGDLDRADQVVAPIRALTDPVFDLLGELPYIQVQSYLDDGEPKGDHYYWKTEYLAELDDGLLSAAREVFAECPMPDGEVGFLQLDGALNERGADDGAVGNRDTRFAVGVKGRWQADGAAAHGFLRWVRDGGERLRPFSTGRTYINFQTADEGEDRVRATYGDNFDRLVQVKQRYDPDNLFRVNRNIPQRALRAVDEQLGARPFLATGGRWYGQARPEWAAFPDIRVEIEHLGVEDDVAALHFRVRGTHEGEFMGAAPTGNRIGVEVMTFLRFGPVLVVNRVRDADEGIARANALPYGLGGSVFAKRRGLELARRMRSGTTAVNSVLSFASMSSLPYGGVGDSGFGRIHGDDGLREFARPKAITTRRARSLLLASTFERDPAATARRVMAIVRLVHGRSRLPQPPSAAARFRR